MRKIKFRGERLNGKFAYGDLGHEWETYGLGPLTYAANKRTFPTVGIYEVKPSSVAQLCGLDKNGREVYESDILLDELDNEHVAEIYDRPNFLAELVLKENADDEE